MEADRQSRGGRNQPTEPTQGVSPVTSEGPVLQLHIHGVELWQLPADLTDMIVSQALDVTVAAAQQVLVEVEDGHLEKIVQVPSQRVGVCSDAAQLIAGGSNR